MSDEKGHFRCYQAKKFTDEHMKIIGGVNHIIEDHERQGFILTVRQIFYQFVSNGWLPNKQSEYDRLGKIISEGRIAGLISWTAIEDRNRSLRGIETYDSPLDIIEQARASYAIDKWENQHWRPEVWVEKAALEGVVGMMCNKLQVNFFATRGYNSQSEQWRAGQRFASYIRKGQRPIVFHLGDHDPSGIDMTRDNRDRLEMFCGTPVMVVRLALNMNQIEEYNPPPNPAKMKDSRAKEYVRQYGKQSWELDALPPRVIHDLIEKSVKDIRDPDLWDQMVAKEVGHKRLLDGIIRTLKGDLSDDDD